MVFANSAFHGQHLHLPTMLQRHGHSVRHRSPLPRWTSSQCACTPGPSKQAVRRARVHFPALAFSVVAAATSASWPKADHVVVQDAHLAALPPMSAVISALQFDDPCMMAMSQLRWWRTSFAAFAAICARRATRRTALSLSSPML